MTFTDGFQRFETTLASRMRTSFAQARRAYMQHRLYRNTYAELDALSERELDDLGLARGDIESVAWAAATKK